MKKNFLNFLKKIQLPSKHIIILDNSVIVEDLKFDPKTKTVNLVLKQYQFLELETLETLEETIANCAFKVSIVWTPQLHWNENLLIVKDYCNWFLKLNKLDNVLIKKVDFLKTKQILKLLVFGSLYKINQTNLKLFLKKYGIAINELLLTDCPKKIKDTKFIKEFQPKEPQLIINHLQKETELPRELKIIKGKILDIKEKIYLNIQKFFILVESQNYLFYVNIKIAKPEDGKEIDFDGLKIKNWVIFRGYVYKNIFFAKKAKKISTVFTKEDNHFKKRIELHLHTKMSPLDGVGDINDYLEYANHWNHSAIAITDHNNIHIFPEAEKISQKFPDLKLIYGCEFTYLNSKEEYILNQENNQNLHDATFIFFDIETTGLSSKFNEIIEFAAIIQKNDLVVGKESFLIKCQDKIPDSILEFTQINKVEFQKNAISLSQALKKIKTIFSDHILVAHNAKFDFNFINDLFLENNIEPIKNPIIDTLNLSRVLNLNLKFHKLGSIARKFRLNYSKSNAHRALYDTTILQKIFSNMTKQNNLVNLKELWKLNAKLKLKEFRKKFFPFHLNVLAKNRKGLKDLYRLVSLSSVDYLYREPTLEKDILMKYRENLLVGSGCQNGEVFQTACLHNDQKLKEVISFYDYIELQPLTNYFNLIEKRFINEKDLPKIIWRIIKVAKKLNKPIVATGDVHYLQKQDKFFRNIFIFNKQLGGRKHPLSVVSPEKITNQHFRTTKEMLKAFDFLKDEKLIEEIVIENTHLIANQIEKVQCFDKKFLMPAFDNCKKDLETIALEKLASKYGKKLDPELKKRFDEELNIIIKANYSTIYLISYALTNYSLKNNYLFGSRGSVGSSFLAYCLDITEVNPLAPHYICKNCFYFEWNNNQQIKSGFDLQDKDCLKCGKNLKKNGHNIKFESFLGLKAENIPDIDLNFSGLFQERAQKFVYNFISEKLGKNKVFWTGTISTVAKKLAYGYYKNFLEKFPLLYKDDAASAKIETILFYSSGIKKTTGQHPGGLMIVPQDRDILDYSPYNYPSNNINSNSLTTHFSYDFLKDQLLKIDVLGHDDPTGLKMLHKMTGINPKDIDLSSKEIVELFYDYNILNFKDESKVKNNGMLGIPEFGTDFVSRMVEEAGAKNFANLIALSGLSHGKNVWENNAKDLIEGTKLINNVEKFSLDNVISCRDDILQYLMSKNIDQTFSYKIMQKVKKGKTLSTKEENHLRVHNVPAWYIDSCRKIKYLFPKAHATAYVIMAARFAWYKIHFPHEFYAMCFTIRSDIFDLKTISKGIEAIEKEIKKLEIKKNNSDKSQAITAREKRLLYVYYLALEMWNRDVTLENIDLKISKAEHFIVKIVNDKKIIIPPFNVIDALGSESAKSIIIKRDEFLEEQQKTNKKIISDQNNFFTLEGFKNLTKLNKTALEFLIELKIFAPAKIKKQLTFNF